MGKKNVWVISHSHWDREWYMPFEYHRAYLIDLIDECIKLFETDKEFKCFYLDGHTALIEDYLEIKPQNRELIKKYIAEGRFIVGPWYVLQDEFLTGGESQVRNLNIGTRLAEEFGKVCKIGYFPDSFGNVGQMPQMMKQAGMAGIAFGRGVKPTGMNNKVSDGGDYSSMFSELFWQSPDGSKMPAVLFANWYNNGAELPVDGNKEFWDKKLEEVLKYASTDELLLMNGCDHQPVQKDLSRAMEAARENYPDINFIHSDMESYLRAILKNDTDKLAVVKGELTNQFGDGWWTLANTASAHMEIKRMNKACENALVAVAEPLSVIASTLGKEYPFEMLEYSWKTLLKNHAHDSICGCSVDAVHDEMKTRFAKSLQSAEVVSKRALEYISKHIDTSGFESCDGVFAVINTFGKARSGLVSTEVDVDRIYGSAEYFPEMVKELEKTLYDEKYVVVDDEGNILPYKTSNKFRFGYDLPDDKFRQPYMAKTVEVEFERDMIPALGFKVYGVKKVESEREKSSLVTADNTMENGFVKVTVNGNGTINIFDKKNDRSFDNLLMLEDVGDIGNEYVFFGVKGDMPITSEKSSAKIELVKDEEYGAEYKVTVKMSVPKAGDDQLLRERYVFDSYFDREAKRSDETVELVVESFVGISKASPEVKVRTQFVNTAKDHRLRVIIPTEIKCDKHKAESMFELAERDNKHGIRWENPCGSERQQGFVLMNDDKSGLAVSSIAMHEYEILENNEIALTAVRAVGELGDWGVFPTESSQCLEKAVCEYSIIPFADENTVIDICVAKQYPISVVQIFDTEDDLKLSNNFKWTGEELTMTALKKSPVTNDIIMRWVNFGGEECTLSIDKTEIVNNLYRSDVTEAVGEEVSAENGKFEVKVAPYEIVTVGIKQ